ncbi:unnamed protein product [Brugia timori]|uniref:Uncharacterized protein n=1 Tax=Brugia timori TaxID=42155 RepID=A0A0R3R965_9BILA|nr:unnamed protein product [Brugia timori]
MLTKILAGVKFHCRDRSKPINDYFLYGRFMILYIFSSSNDFFVILN